MSTLGRGTEAVKLKRSFWTRAACVTVSLPLTSSETLKVFEHVSSAQHGIPVKKQTLAHTKFVRHSMSANEQTETDRLKCLKASQIKHSACVPRTQKWKLDADLHLMTQTLTGEVLVRPVFGLCYQKHQLNSLRTSYNLEIVSPECRCSMFVNLLWYPLQGTSRLSVCRRPCGCHVEQPHEFLTLATSTSPVQPLAAFHFSFLLGPRHQLFVESVTVKDTQ